MATIEQDILNYMEKDKVSRKRVASLSFIDDISSMQSHNFNRSIAQRNTPVMADQYQPPERRSSSNLKLITQSPKPKSKFFYPNNDGASVVRSNTHRELKEPAIYVAQRGQNDPLSEADVNSDNSSMSAEEITPTQTKKS